MLSADKIRLMENKETRAREEKERQADIAHQKYLEEERERIRKRLPIILFEIEGKIKEAIHSKDKYIFHECGENEYGRCYGRIVEEALKDLGYTIEWQSFTPHVDCSQEGQPTTFTLEISWKKKKS